MTAPHGPLQGVKVVACSTAQAGTVPYMLMADLGAEVIKIEVPDGGDTSRTTSVLPGLPSTYFETNNRGVKSVTLNLKTAEGPRDPAQAGRAAPRSSARTSGPARRRRTASATRTCARSIRSWSTCRSPVTGRMVRTPICPAPTRWRRRWAASPRRIRRPASRCAPASSRLPTKPVRSWRSAARSRR